MGKSVLFAGIALLLLYVGWGVVEVLSGRGEMKEAWEGLANACQLRQEVATQYIGAAATALDHEQPGVKRARLALTRVSTVSGRLVVPKTSHEFHRYCELQDELTHALVLLASMGGGWSKNLTPGLASVEAEISRAHSAFVSARHRHRLAVEAFSLVPGRAPVRATSCDKQCCAHERVSVMATERL